MTDSVINTIGISLGIFLLVGYLTLCWKRKSNPQLPEAVTCVLTGGGFVVGCLLVWGAFDPSLMRDHLRPEHYVIAGLAILWVSTQFVWRLAESSDRRNRDDSMTAATDDADPQTPSDDKIESSKKNN